MFLEGVYGVSVCFDVPKFDGVVGAGGEELCVLMIGEVGDGSMMCL